MDPRYAALRDKVDAAVESHTRALADQLRCARGCTACCAAELTVCGVEAEAVQAELAALPTEARRAVRARARGGAAACVMLEPDGACLIYAARPLVCRTQGLPLRYPSAVVPVEAVRVRTPRGDVVVCPLNFETRPPTLDESLDAERIDTLLALVEHQAADGAAGGRRAALRALAAADDE